MAPRTRSDKDYYAVLGVRLDASEEEVRRAYRRLALRWHPDRNPGQRDAEEQFKEISEAYGVLIDPVKRRDYDASRRAGTPGEFRHTREEVFRDLFTDPRASAVFDELRREFERLGVRVDQRDFRQTLFGGRAVVMGGIVVVTPFTPIRLFARLAGVALRAAGPRASTPRRDVSALPQPRRLLAGARRLGRWLWGLPAAEGSRGATPLATEGAVRITLSRAEAERGGQKRITLSPQSGGGEVLVTIPPGVRPGTKLRLRARGPAGADVYLAVDVRD